jgi:hypothetical protein
MVDMPQYVQDAFKNQPPPWIIATSNSAGRASPGWVGELRIVDADTIWIRDIFLANDPTTNNNLATNPKIVISCEDRGHNRSYRVKQLSGAVHASGSDQMTVEVQEVWQTLPAPAIRIAP